MSKPEMLKPVVEATPAPVPVLTSGVLRPDLMRDMAPQELKMLPLADRKLYVELNTPRWREKAHTMVSGVFKNLELRGGSLEFNFPIFPGEDFQRWYFVDGQHYRIPYSVAVHLNDDCFYKEYTEVKGDFGKDKVQNALHNGQAKSSNMQMAAKVYRYAFHSLEFSRDDLSINRSTIATPIMSN